MSSKKSSKNTSFYIFLGIFLIFFGLSVYYSSKYKIVQIVSSPSPVPTSNSQITYAKVTRVIDGDTIVIDTGQHVRYIGMNTPELESSECYATEASEINKNLVLGKTVKLEKDVSETDKYGRLLRFVYVDDTFVDDYLVKDGAAKIMTVPPDVEYKDEFFQSQNYAKENKLGLWGKCQN
jgi:micrococcal nuclease